MQLTQFSSNDLNSYCKNPSDTTDQKEIFPEDRPISNMAHLTELINTELRLQNEKSNNIRLSLKGLRNGRGNMNVREELQKT